MKHVLFFTVIMGASLMSLAQQAPETDTSTTLPLTLAQVWEKAADYNKTVSIKKMQQAASAELVKDAKNDRLPELGVGGEYARITNMPVFSNGIFHTPSQFEVLHSTYTVETEAYLNLYNGGKTNIEIARRKTENALSGEQLQLTLSEVKLQAAAYYLDMQRSLVFIELMQKDIETQQKQLERLRVLKANGVLLKSDVLRAELKLSRQRLTLVTLRNDLTVANEKLDFLIGLPKEQRITPSAVNSADTLALKPLDNYLADAGSGAYQLKVSEQETALAALRLKDIKANVRPKVGLFGTYKYSYPQIFLYPYSPYIYGIGLGGIKASFSISSIYHNYHKSKAARLDYERQRIEHAQTEDHVVQMVDEAFLRCREALNRIEVSEANVRQAVENQRIVRNTYFNQTSLITDLLDADTQLLQTRFDLAAAKIAARFQYYQLQNITGKL